MSSDQIARERIAVYLPAPLKRRLRHHIADTGGSMSATVESVLERFLQRAAQRKEDGR